MSDDKSITVIYDGNRSLLKQNVWKQSELLVEMVEDGEDGEDDIDLAHAASIDNEVMNKVIEWMKAMADIGDGEGALQARKTKTFADNFLEPMEEPDKWPLLFQTVIGANYLNIRTLLDASCKFVDKMINKISPEEMAEYFNITISNKAEDDLIRNYPLLDPHNLIARDRENINTEEAEPPSPEPAPALAPAPAPDPAGMDI